LVRAQEEEPVIKPLQKCKGFFYSSHSLTSLEKLLKAIFT
jgi:hypothetical protein